MAVDEKKIAALLNGPAGTAGSFAPVRENCLIDFDPRDADPDYQRKRLIDAATLSDAREAAEHAADAQRYAEKRAREAAETAAEQIEIERRIEASLTPTDRRMRSLLAGRSLNAAICDLIECSRLSNERLRILAGKIARLEARLSEISSK